MAIDTEELAVIKSGISSAMNESAGQFRQAANAGAANMTKIVKDISNIFAAQRRDLANLSNSMDEVAHELEQSTSKFDQLERVFEESISIQTAMRAEIKTMVSYTKSLNEGIYQLDRNIQSSLINGPNSLLSGLTTGLASGFGGVTGKLGDLILKIGGGAVLGGAAVAGANYLSGGGAVPGGVYEGSTQFSLQTKEGKNLNISEGDIQRLAKISALEAGSLGESGRQAVVDTVLNRAMSGKYGGSDIKSVLSSPKQFSPVNPYGDIDRTPGPKNMEKYVDEVKKYLAARAGGAKSQLGSSQYTMFLNPNISGQHALSTWYQDMLKAGGVKQYGSGRDVHQHGVGKYAVPEYTVSATGIKPDQYANQGPSDQDATPAAQTPASQNVSTSREGASPQTQGSVSTSSLEVKGGMQGQAFSGGEVHPGVMALASKIQGSVPGFNRFTAFNDAYHHRVNPGSKHAQGLAADFTLQDPSKSEQAANQIRQLLQSMGVSGKVLNEYTNPSAHATGGHIHVQFDSAQEAEKFKSGKATEPSKEQEKTEVATKQESKSAAESISPTYAATTSMATAVSATPVTAAAVTPSETTATSTTPPSVTETPAAPPAPEPAATAISQEPVTPAVSAPMSIADTKAMMGMIPGGIEDIFEQIGAFFESLFSPPELISQQQSIQNQNAELLQSLSSSMKATQMISQSAIQSQARQTAEDIPQSSPTSMSPNISASQNKMAHEQAGYAYNYPWDVSWPDWASMIGGNHWSEMRKIKKNMWA